MIDPQSQPYQLAMLCILVACGMVVFVGALKGFVWLMKKGFVWLMKRIP